MHEPFRFGLGLGLDGAGGGGQNAGPREASEAGATPGTSPSRCGERMRRMTTPRPKLLPHVLTLAAGVALGALAAGRAPAVRAGGGDRWDESVLATGPTFVKYNEGSKIQVAQDAVYFLDYRAGKLLATVPSLQQMVGASARHLSAFVERDLVADFKLDLDRGAHPHFLMTTGSMAAGAGNSYGDGWAALYVFETTTRQVAVYKIQQQMIGLNAQVRLDLVELRAFGGRGPSGR
jgi:hypothetical protein